MLFRSSEAGEGARFFVRLPAVAATPAPPPPAPSLAAPSDLFHGRRILVVDDNPIGQQVTSKMLQRLGAQTTLAGDGRTVLDLLETQRFDVILMDCQMPIMDGFEATAELRRREAATGRPRPLRPKLKRCAMLNRNVSAFCPSKPFTSITGLVR